jgi:hypothetical protein
MTLSSLVSKISATWKALKSKRNGYIYVIIGHFSMHFGQCEKVADCHELTPYVKLLKIFMNLDAWVCKTVSFF